MVFNYYPPINLFTRSVASYIEYYLKKSACAAYTLHAARERVVRFAPRPSRRIVATHLMWRC